MAYQETFETKVMMRLTVIESNLSYLTAAYKAHLDQHNPHDHSSPEHWYHKPAAQMVGAGAGGGIAVATIQLLIEIVKRA